MTQQLIKINHLERSPLNVRKTEPKAALEELKASILAHGLMQNLVVVPGKTKGRYEVIAGGRRLSALIELRDEGKLPDEFDVPCQVADAEQAAEMSLAENTIRHAMHPADEHAAYTALVGNGNSIEAIALRFGKSRKHVEQRLKLGRAAPQLIEAYRNGEITLEVLEAYTVTDDHERQLHVYESLKDHWNGDEPGEIRAWLTEETVRGDDKRVKFVGLDTYEKAGGALKRDLFGDEVFLENPELLDALVAEKLKLAKAALEAEGWAWVTVAHERDWNVTAGCKHLDPSPLDAPQDLLDQAATLDAEFEALEAEWEAAEDDETIADVRKRRGEAHKRKNALQEQLEAYLRFTPEQIQRSGCYAYIDHSGEFEVERGLVKRDEAKTAPKGGGADSHQATAEKPKGFPESLKRDLEAFRLGVAQMAIASNPAIAYDLLVFKATKAVCSISHAYDGPQISFQQQSGGTAGADARGFIDQKMDAIEESLPLEWQELDSQADQFAAFQALSAEQKHQLLAFCVARTLQPKLLDGEPSSAYDLALAQTGVAVADHWRPGAASFLSRLNSAALLELGSELFDPTFASRWAKAKKGELVAVLDKAFADPSKDERPEVQERLRKWIPEGMAFGASPAEPAEKKPAKGKKSAKAA